jgi:hypothetical protein
MVYSACSSFGVSCLSLEMVQTSSTIDWFAHFSWSIKELLIVRLAEPMMLHIRSLTKVSDIYSLQLIKAPWFPDLITKDENMNEFWLL